MGTRLKSLLLVASLFMSVFYVAQTVIASHKWICSGTTAWKYADKDISWYNGTSGDYYDIYQEEMNWDSNSWDKYTKLDLTTTTSLTTDQARGYAGYYGETGWLGLATIVEWSGCTITKGKSQLNKTYFENGSYTRTNKKHTACQELGHLWGLDHNRNATDTCMNDKIGNAPYPSSHDKDVVYNLYTPN